MLLGELGLASSGPEAAAELSTQQNPHTAKEITMNKEIKMTKLMTVFLATLIIGLPWAAAADKFEGAPIPDKLVVLTFDDGNKSDITYAAPLLKRYGPVVMLFRCVGRCDRRALTGLRLLIAKVPHFAGTKLSYRSRWALRWIEKP